MMIPFQLQQARAACRAGYRGDTAMLSQPVLGVATDHRQVQPGFLFAALHGERFDGHDFIPAAYENGAIACITQHPVDCPITQLIVSSSLEALGDLAYFYRQLFDIKIVAITGSAGKTTTKEMVSAVLSQGLRVLKTEGNFNNQIGVPLTVFRLEREHQAAVVEMGTNHFGEIDSIARIVQPDIGLFTNIGHAHLEHFGSQEGILRAKSEMLAHIRPGGCIVIHGDDMQLNKLKGAYPHVVTYGMDAQHDYVAQSIEPMGIEGSQLEVHDHGKAYPVFIPAPGRHMVLNALAAYAVGRLFGLEPTMILTGISQYKPLVGRMKIEKNDSYTVLEDYYNANPSAMAAAIDTLVYAKGRKVCILGDMGELGQDAAQYHHQIGGYAAERGVDFVLCVGTLAQEIYRGVCEKGGSAVHFATQEALLREITQYICVGDTILIKGSRMMALEKTAEYIMKK